MKHFTYTAVRVMMLLAAAICTFPMYAQEATPADTVVYDMTFVGRGETTTVDKVTVENLTTGEELILSGTDILRLTPYLSTGLENISGVGALTQPLITPNPAAGEGRLIFDAPATETIRVSITAMSGQVKQEALLEVTAGRNALTLPAQEKGMYIVSIQGTGIDASCKWISLATSDSRKDITLNNAAGEQLQMRQAQAANHADVKIVEMLFHEGDLLRFVGESGHCKTILMNSPTCSHDITFDFYTCQDATGRHYPVVRVGDLLWMAEDLGYVGAERVPLMRAASVWKQYDATKPMAAYYDFNEANAAQGAYYNFSGAKAAMPEGWMLPSAGEVDFMVKKLGGYTAASNLLKSHAPNAWLTYLTDKDSTCFNALPDGYLSPAGEFDQYLIGVRYLTRSTLRGGYPVYFEISDADSVKLDPKKPLEDLRYGFKVRGCRPAPTAYDNMLNQFMTAQEIQAKNKPAANNDGVFGNGPLGNNYTMAVGKQKLLTNISTYLPNAADPQGTTVHDSYTQKTMYNNLPNYGQYLKKAAVVNNTNGRQNMVIALWSNKLLDYRTDGGIWSNVDGLAGAGYVDLVFVGDSTQGYAKVDSIRLSTEFILPALDDSWDFLRDGYNLQIGTAGYTQNAKTSEVHIHVVGHTYRIMEMYSKRFNVLAADFNGDGTDDIVVIVGKKIAIFDGVTFRQISSREFTSNNVRAAIGDIDDDGAKDLAVLYGSTEENIENCQVEVYLKGDLANKPALYRTAPKGVTNDIKVGDVTGDNRDDIVTLSAEWMDADYSIRLFTYDESQTSGLKVLSSIDAQHKYDISDNASLKLKNKPTILSSTLTLLHKRGAMHPADIMLGGEWLRWNDETKKLEDMLPTYGNIAKMPNSGNKFNYIPSDCVWAANLNGNQEGKETLVYLATGHPAYTINPWSNYISRMDESVSFNTCWYDYEGGSGSIGIERDNYLKHENVRFYSTLEGDGNNFWYTDDEANYTTAFTFPLLMPVRSGEAATVLKFKKHETTMSEPRIYALLAAPPYYSHDAEGNPYTYDYDLGTAWGVSTTVADGKENSSSTSAAAITGYEQDFTVPIIGKKVGEIDFTLKAEYEWTNSTTKETTTSKSTSFESQGDDAVVLQAYFYDSYDYEIVASGDVDAIGTTMTFSLPRTPRTMMITLADYERLAADDRNIPRLRHIFRHKVGQPFSYPSHENQIYSNVRGCEVLWGNPVEGESFIGAGSGGCVTREITLDESTTTAAGFSSSIEVELVGSVYGVKLGAGFGYNNSNTTTHTEGEGHTVGGTVPGLRRLGEGGLADFRWNICWYQYYYAGQYFPIVYYVVKK